MAGEGGASEITPEQVIAAITDLTQKIELLDAQLAAGQHPITEHRLACLRRHKSLISAEIADLTIVLEGVRRGDLAFTEQIPPQRLDELLAARTDRVARFRGVPLETRLQMESANRAFRLAVDMSMRASSARRVIAAPDKTRPVRDGQMDDAVAEVNRDAAASAPVEASAREGLARLQI